MAEFLLAVPETSSYTSLYPYRTLLNWMSDHEFYWTRWDGKTGRGDILWVKWADVRR